MEHQNVSLAERNSTGRDAKYNVPHIRKTSPCQDIILLRLNSEAGVDTVESVNCGNESWRDPRAETEFLWEKEERIKYGEELIVAS